MKLDLAKLVEQRRRSRIDRARQLASNIETQAHILRQTDLYNLQAEYLRMKSIVDFGNDVPAVARARYHTIRDNIRDIESQPTVAAIAPTVSRQRTTEGEIPIIPTTKWKLPRRSYSAGDSDVGLGPWIKSMRSIK